MALDENYSRMGRGELIAALHKLRQHVYNARPSYWVQRDDSLAAKLWERESAKLLGLEVQIPTEPPDAA